MLRLSPGMHGTGVLPLSSHSHTNAHTHTHPHTHTYTHTYIHTHTCACTHTHTHIHACTHTHTHTYTCAHVHTHTHTHKHACMHTHTHACAHTDIHTHTHTCMYTHTHSHTHTHTHTYTQTIFQQNTPSYLESLCWGCPLEYFGPCMAAEWPLSALCWGCNGAAYPRGGEISRWPCGGDFTSLSFSCGAASLPFFFFFFLRSLMGSSVGANSSCMGGLGALGSGVSMGGGIRRPSMATPVHAWDHTSVRNKDTAQTIFWPSHVKLWAD